MDKPNTGTVDVEAEKMKMYYMEYTTEETKKAGLNVKRKHSVIRGKDLEECWKYTELLHVGLFPTTEA